METTTNIVKVDASKYGLEEKSANQLTKGLAIVLKEREVLISEFETVSKLEVTKESIPQFRELRLKIQKNRTQGIDKWHKAGKEYFLRGGQFLDAIKKVEVQVNEQMEEHLLNGEKYFENLEIERIKKLNAERIELLSPYVEDVTGLNLVSMEEDVWEAYLSAKKSAYGAKIEAERVAEEERIAKEKAEEEAREKQRLENERLKAEAEKREKEIEAERKKQASILKKQQEESEAKLRAEREKATSEKAKLEAELQAKKDAEAKAERERLAKIAQEKLEAEKLAKAPVKQKLKKWVGDFAIPELDVQNEKKIIIEAKFEAFKKWALNEVESI